MNCPHCHVPIPDAEVVRAAASINANKAPKGEGARPGAIGLKRNPAGRKGKPKPDSDRIDISDKYGDY